MTAPHVVVAGGGLAGIAAACEASLRGARVTLLERRPFLGGKAYSFEVDGREVDNGQHVFLGCCTAYRWLLRLLGTERLTTLQRRLSAPVRDRGGRRGLLAASALPAPLTIGPAFLAYPHLSTREKASAMRALTALLAMGERRRGELDETTFADWLAGHGQRQGAIDRFWDLLVLPTCNDRCDRVSASLAAFVFREGLFRTARGSAIGYATVGLSRVVEPVVGFLSARGSAVRFGSEVATADGSGVVTSHGERIAADAVVLALPPERVGTVLPGGTLRHPVAVGESPIVNVHVWFDRPVLDDAFTAVVESPAQWIFNRTAIAGGRGPEHLAVSISGAHAEFGRPREALREEIVEELRAVLPAARRAEVLTTHVVKEPRATFDPGPGQARRRPDAMTNDPLLFLAGAWTNTGWPATMEGAVRSGIRAARLALDAGARAAGS